MALKPCRECGAQVSTEAEVCPHCGVRSPTATDPLAALAPSGNKQGKITGFGWFTLVLVGGIIVLFVFFSNEAPKETACDSDWRKCADNEQLVNNYSRWTSVKVECKRGR